MPNFTIPKWAHIGLYLLSAVLTAIVALATKGDLTFTVGTLGILTTVLSVVNSVNGQTAAKMARKAGYVVTPTASVAEGSKPAAPTAS